MGVQWIDFKKA